MTKQEINKAFLRAAHKGLLKEVVGLLSKGADLTHGSDGALRLASLSGHIPVVEFLLGATEDHGGTRLEVALRSAAYHGQVPIVDWLLGKNKNIHLLNFTFLLAARSGQLLTLQNVLQKDEKVLQISGEKAFFLACSYGHLPIVKYLLVRGVDLHHENECSLTSAVTHNRLQMTQYLVSEGASLEIGLAIANLSDPDGKIFNWLSGVHASGVEKKVLQKEIQKVSHIKQHRL